MPYSRILFDNIIEGVDDHLLKNKTQFECLEKLNCNNILTFRLHFFRVLDLLPKWINLLSAWIIDLDTGIKKLSLTEVFATLKGIKKHCLKWNQFKRLVELYAVSFNRIPGTASILTAKYFQFAHCKFILSGVPLGP